MNNNRDLVYLIIVIFISSILKANYQQFNVKDMLIYWNDLQIVNLIWFFPIVFIIFFFSKKFLNDINHFDVRYKNRKKYIEKVILKNLLIIFIGALVIQIVHINLINIFSKKIIVITFKDLLFILELTFEILFVCFNVAFIAMIIKNYIYSFVTNVMIILFMLISSINLNMFYKNNYFPLVRMYLGEKGIIITIILFVLIIIVIRRTYLHHDMIGGANDET